MDKNTVSKMQKILLKQRSDILNILAHESEEFKELLEDKEPKDLVDIASGDIDKRILETLEVQDLKRLRLIDAALARIENDRYGVCMECGKKIPEERLEAIPYSLLCLECKAKEEKKRH